MSLIEAFTPEQIPQNYQAEAALLGAIMINNDAYYKCASILEHYHFHFELHREIWSAMVERIEAQKLATPVTLFGDLQTVKVPDDISLAKYLAQLCGDATFVGNVKGYALDIKSMWARREMMMVGEHVVTSAAALGPDDEKLPVLAGEIYSRIDAITDSMQDAKVGRAMLGDVAQQVYQSINKNEFDPGIGVGLSTVDDKLNGLRGGQLIILAARPGMGKSTIALSWAMSMAARGIGVGFFSLEMPRESLAMRALSTVTAMNKRPIHYSWMRRGKMDEVQMDVMKDAANYLTTMPCLIDDRADITCGQIGAGCKQIQSTLAGRKAPLGIIFIDHMGIVRPGDRYEGNKVAETGEVSRFLKTLSKNLGIPVVALCQLSREVEKRDIKRPQLSDLRWSGDIEQDADVVIMLYREAYYLQMVANGSDENALKAQMRLDQVGNTLEVLIEKNRDGQRGMIEVDCDVATGLVTDKWRGAEIR